MPDAKPTDGRDIRQLPCPELPELEIVGNTEIQKPLPTLDIPFKADCINIYFGYKGSKQMQAEGDIYELNGGEFFLTPAGITHSTGPMPVSKCAHYWLRLHIGHSETFLGDQQFESLRTDLCALPICHGKYSEASFQTLRSIYDLATRPASLQRDMELRIQLALFLLKLLEQIRAVDEAPQAPHLDAVVDFLEHHIGEQVSVQEMANVVGVSVSTLQQLFQKHKGMSPLEYFNRQKINAAKQLLLETDHSIRSISEQLGFTNERYFSTVFRKYHTQPPGRFRQEHNAKSAT